MSEANLPRHIIDQVERRWAAHLAKDAQSWMNSRIDRARSYDVAGKAGRIPVRFKKPRASHGVRTRVS